MTRLIQISDVHFGREDERALDQVLAFLDEFSPDAVIVCGDLTQRGKTSEFAAARQWLDKITAPRLVVPGNHDTPLLNLAARVATPFAKYEDHFGDLSEDMTIGSIDIRGLNTARGWQARTNWAEGSVDLEDLSAIAGTDQLADIVVCHHPFQSLPDAPLQTRTRRGKEAHDIMASGSPKLLLTGHVHKPSATVQSTRDGAYLAIAAGTLSTRLRDAPPGFNALTFQDDQLQVDSIEVGGDRPLIQRLGDWSLNRLALKD